MSGAPRISNHAIQRYRERVDPDASRQEARGALHRFVLLGRSRSRPRHWMRGRPTVPGTRYVYWAGRPSLCLVVADGCVVTVVTRELCRTQPRSGYLRALPRPAAEEARWRWDGYLDEAV
jgi:hypothetical protein